MFSTLDNYINSNKNAVILCNDQKILDLITYKNVINISDIITKSLKRHISNENICLALYMNHNLYIPSIILSLQKLNHALVFVTSKSLEKTVEDLKVNWILSLKDIKDIKQFREIDRFELRERDSLTLWQRSLPLSANFNYSNIFCVVQTSGTTGENKIIRVPHTCIQPNASALRKLFKINHDDIIYWGTPLTFDPSLIELLLALQTGATLLIVPYEVSINPSALYKSIFCIKNVTVLQMVPSIFLRWNETQIRDILKNSALRILAFGGENFPKKLLGYEKRDSLRLFNLYGISEVSCWASACEIDNATGNDDVPIGQSLEETVVEMRDEDGNKIEYGEGEIVIGSTSRICYLDKENPEDHHQPVFRETGDLANATDKGIFLIGRKNKVIKRFGHRINLAKIESLLFKDTSLESRCIWSREHNKIMLFILIKDLDLTIKEKIIDKLRVKLIGILTEENLPDFIEIVQNFPLTSHGKVNEKALERLYLMPKTKSSYVDTFCYLWSKYLGLNMDNLDEYRDLTFFEMGGNSTRALQFITEFKELTELECPDEIYNIFDKSFVDCLNPLKKITPLPKRCFNEIDDRVNKKEKHSEDELQILWSYDLKACVDCSPLVYKRVSETYIAIGSFSRIFIIINEKGETVFKKNFPDNIESTPVLSPCVNYLLIGCYNGIMYCVDLSTNDIAWNYKTDNKIKSSGGFCKDGSAVVFGSYDKKIHCVSLKDGTPVWTTPLDGSIPSTPIYNGDKKIFAATTSGTCVCLDEETGVILWNYNCGGPIFGTPCFLDSNQGIAYPVVKGTLCCLSSRFGNILWTFQTGGHVFSSVVRYMEYLVFGCHDKRIYVVKASISNCELMYTVDLSSEISSTPFIGLLRNRNVIISACNSGFIYVVDAKTGNVLCRKQLPGETFSSPFLYGNKIYVGCRDNNLYCIKLCI